MSSSRSDNEVNYARKVSEGDPELIWGWGSPAGRVRSRRRADFIANGAQLKPGMRVLEIGCGNGYFTEMFATSGASIIAVDISPELIEQAKGRGLPAEQVTFLVKRFEDCDVDGPFDAVIGSSILHHLEIEPALEKIRELLKPGGVFSFAEPNMLNPQVFLERKLSFMRSVFWYISPDETAFVRWSFASLLKRYSFQDISITPFDWLHPAIPPALISTVSGIGRMLELMPLAREFSGSVYIHARRSE